MYRADSDHLTAAGAAHEGQRELQDELQRAVGRPPLGERGEPRCTAIAQEGREAPEVVARLGLMPAPDDPATRVLDGPLERVGREVREVTRQLESAPGAPEERGAEPAGVRDLDDQEPARREPIEHALHHRDGVHDVLQHVKRRDDVEASRRERRLEHVPDVDLVGEPARLLRRRCVHLDAGDPPPQRARQAEPGARAAADVEIAPITDPRQAIPAETAPQRPRPQAREDRDVAIVKAGVAEPARERPAHGTDPRGRALERHAWRRLLVPGIVIRVARREELVVNARPLIEKSTIAAPCDGVEAWERERPVGGRPHWFGARASTEHARYLDRRKSRHPLTDPTASRQCFAAQSTSYWTIDGGRVERNTSDSLIGIVGFPAGRLPWRSEEHTSELQSH